MSLRSTMEAAGNYRAHYDAACKEILGCKQILANIMGERIPGEEQFTVSLYETKKRDIIGTTEEERKHYQLMNAVIIRLGEDRRAKDDRIFRLLQALFGKELALEEKLARLKKLGIRIDDRLEKEVEEMCNLSEGIWRDGRRDGEKRMSSLNLRLLKDKRYEDLKRASTDQEYRDKLFRQYQI